MNYHALGILPPSITVLDGGGLTSPRDSGKLKADLRLHEGGQMAETVDDTIDRNPANYAESDAAIPEIALVARWQYREIPKANQEDGTDDRLIAWREDTIRLLTAARPSVGQFFTHATRGTPDRQKWTMMIEDIGNTYARHLRRR